MTTPERHSVRVSDDDTGTRLDRFLSDNVNDLSRSRVKALIKDGRVSQENTPVTEPNRSVKAGELYDLEIPPAVPAEPRPENIPLNVVFEDASVIVIDKPSGLVVHPAAGNWSGTLVNALISHCGGSLSGIGGVRRPGIVHRLDKDTSGLMVVAKTDAAHKSLTEQFAAHGRDGRMQRTYQAIVWGVPRRPRGTIDAPIGRARGNRTKMAVVSPAQPDAKSAVTRFNVLETFAGPDRADVASRVRCVLETGRTHQIRVHMAHLGHPLLGDAAYGAGFATSANLLAEPAQRALAHLKRQALHACELGFEHPLTQEAMHFSSALPKDLEDLVGALSPGTAAGNAS